MKKVLFSTVWGPYAEQYFNTSPSDVMNQRFSRGCDIFTLNSHVHMNWAHVIAQNIEAPSVFLEYPHKEDFLKEVEKGYDYIAISSFHNQVAELIDMCKTVRQKAPKSQIVLGGFGAVGLESTKTQEELDELCDHLCHEEGTFFFRKLLGEQVDRSMFHYHLPKCGYSFPMLGGGYTSGIVPTIVGSLGCTNGCDFCATTEYFCGRRIEMMTPEKVHKEFKRAYRENPFIPQVTLLEEDSYQDIEYMQELGKLLREDTEFGLGYYSFVALSSVRSMSQWSFEDMALTGASTIFVGVESKFAGDHGYEKTRGKSYKEMFNGLHNVGIATTGAWMVGFDFQNRQNIEEDLQDFIALEPSTQQLTRVCPFPGTPFWKEMKKEGRIRDDVKWEEISFYGGGGLPPKNFNEHEVMNIIERGYKELYETHGASIARYMNVSMRGYEYCMEHKHRNKYLEDRAVYHKRMSFATYPMLKAMEVFAPNNTVRKLMKDYKRKYHRLYGKPTTLQKGVEKLLLGVSGVNKLLDVIYPIDNKITEEPFKKYTYNKPAPQFPEKPYSTEYPHRTWKFSAFKQIQGVLSGLMGKAGQFAMLRDMRQGVEFDESMDPETLSRLL